MAWTESILEIFFLIVLNISYLKLIQLKISCVTSITDKLHATPNSKLSSLKTPLSNILSYFYQFACEFVEWIYWVHVLTLGASGISLIDYITYLVFLTQSSKIAISSYLVITNVNMAFSIVAVLFEHLVLTHLLKIEVKGYTPPIYLANFFLVFNLFFSFRKALAKWKMKIL